MKKIGLFVALILGISANAQLSDEPCGAGSIITDCTPTAVTLDGAYTETTTPAEPGDGNCLTIYSSGSIEDADMWFTTTADANGEIDVYGDNISGDCVIGLYNSPTNSCSNLNFLVCDDDGGSGLDSWVTYTGLTPGETIWVRVWDYSGSWNFPASYNIISDGGTAPANDDCANAAGLTINAAPIAGDNYCATVEASDYSDCESNTENNVWYSFTLSQTGTVDVNLTAISCFGSGAGLDMSVFSGSCGSFTNEICSASISGSGTVSFSGSAGTTYYVMVDGDNDGSSTALCDFDIDVNFTPLPCPTVDFGYTASLACDEATFLAADDSVTAGGYLTPGFEFEVMTDAFAENTINIYVDSMTGSGSQLIYTGSTIPTNMLYGLYGGYDNNNFSYTVEMCDANGDGSFPYTIYDLATNTVITSGTMDFDAVPGTGSQECLTATFGPNWTTATMSWDVSPAAYQSALFDYEDGVALFPTYQIPVGSYDITYNWNNGAGCSGSETHTITIGPAPTATDASMSVCASPSGNGTFDLTTLNSTVMGGASNTITWVTDAYSVIGTPSAHIVNSGSSPATVYALVEHASSACVDTAEITLTIDALPTVAIAATITLDCTNEDQVLDGSGSSQGAGFSYSWNTTGNIVSGGSTDSPTIDAPGDYTLIVTNGTTGCVDSTSVSITEDVALPTVAVAAPGDITCTDLTLVLDGSGSSQGAGYTYSWNTTGNVVSGGTTDSPTIDAGGDYTLVVTNTGNGCVDSATVTVTVDQALPTASVAAPAVLDCDNSSQVLDGTGSSQGANYDYAWGTTGNITSGGTTDSPTIDAPGDYTLTVTNTVNGCQANDMVTVTQDVGLPTVAIAAPGDITCTTLSIALDGSGSSQGAGFTYSWNTTGNIVSGGSTDSPTVDAAGDYTLIVTNTASGCVDSTTVTVALDQTLPTVSIAVPIVLDCANPTQVLDGTGSSQGANFSYSWNTTGNVDSDGTTDSPTIDDAGDYTLVVTNTTNGCVDSSTVAVNLDQTLPTVSVSTPDVLTCSATSQVLDGTGSSQGGSYSYNWNTTGNIVSGGTTDSPTIDSPGDYTLVVTNGSNGCVDSVTVSVIQDVVLPSAVVAAPTVLNCSNPTQILDGTGSSQGADYTYSWVTTGNIVSGSATDSPTVDEAGDYTLTVLDTTNGCSVDAMVTVTIDTITPTGDAGLSQTLTCSATSVSLTGTSSASVSWSGSGLVSGANGLTPTVNVPGTYYMTMTGANGCLAIDSVLVVADSSLPVADAGMPATIDCNNLSLILDGTGSTASLTYSWTTIGGNIVAGASTLNPIVDESGTYVLNVLNTSNGCSANASVAIAVDTVVPMFTFNVPDTITCALTSVNVEVAAYDNSLQYAWITTSGNIADDQDSLVVAAEAGYYTLIVSNAVNGCNYEDSIEVFIDTIAPTAVIDSVATLTCVVDSVLVNGSNSIGSNVVYGWNSQSFGSDTAMYVNQPGLVELFVMSGNGCLDSIEVNVLQDVNVPSANPGADQVIDCNALQVTLDGTASTGGNQYSWSTLDGNILTSTSSLSIDVDLDGTYVLLIEDTTNGCIDSATVEVTMDTVTPSVSIQTPIDLDCANPVITLNGTAQPAGTYSWSGGVASGGTILTPTVDAAGSYSLTSTSSNGCSSTASITVSIDTVAPVADAGIDGDLNCNRLEFVMDGQNSQGTALTYSWSSANGSITGSTNDVSALAGSAGTYVLVVTGDNGCIDSDTVTVTETAGPEANFVPSVYTGNAPLMVEFYNLSNGATSYIWEFGNSMTSTSYEDSTLYDQMGDYTVVLYAIDDNGCTDSAQVMISVGGVPSMIIPNVFTPNHDGLNDEFKITYENVVEFDGQIFNRWGNEVFLWDDIDTPWDGVNSWGQPTPEGVYFYIFKATASNGEELVKTGHFELFR